MCVYISLVYLQVSDTGSVEQRRVNLPHPVHVPHVPHVHTVVVIHTAEPLADGVKGHGDGVRVTGVRLGGEQVADGKEIGINLQRQIFLLMMVSSFDRSFLFVRPLQSLNNLIYLLLSWR